MEFNALIKDLKRKGTRTSARITKHSWENTYLIVVFVGESRTHKLLSIQGPEVASADDLYKAQKENDWCVYVV